MVDVRLDVSGAQELPDDCFISMRVGEAQKLSRMAASRTYQFPHAGGRRIGKIEVFRRVGACGVDVDPSNMGTRQVSITCANLGPLNFDVHVGADAKAKKSKASSAATSSQASKRINVAQEYLSKHKLELQLAEAMQAVLRERPDNPVAFLANKLMQSSSNSIGGTVGSSVVKQAGKSSSEKKKESSRATAPAPVPQMVTSMATGRQTGVSIVPMIDQRHFALQPSIGTWLAPRPAKILSPPEKPMQFKPSVGTWLMIRPPKEEVITPMQLKPSIGTWLMVRPPKEEENVMPTVEVLSTPARPMQFKPSVGTWLMTRPPKEEEEVATPIQFKPSVGTWLMTRPPRDDEVVESFLSAAEVSDVGSARLKPQYLFKPSVGSWIARPQAVKEVHTSAVALTDSSQHAEFCHVDHLKSQFLFKPSVGSWIARPQGVKELHTRASVLTSSLQHIEFCHKPSVGSWLARPVKPDRCQ